MEYKFKAWDKVYKRMEDIDGCNLYLADSKVYEVSEESYAYQSYMNKKDVSDRYIPLPYTGFNDIENNEIYKDDIVSLAGCRFDNARIEFFDGRYELRINNDDVAWGLNSKSIREHKIIVIGNIHQNSEILDFETSL